MTSVEAAWLQGGQAAALTAPTPPHPPDVPRRRRAAGSHFGLPGLHVRLASLELDACAQAVVWTESRFKVVSRGAGLKRTTCWEAPGEAGL